MPSERFNRLSDLKKNVIRQAIMKEYARVQIDKVSINKIIKDADISRGSFYTYFQDKWDILAYIFEDGHKSMRRFCMNNLEKNNGNIWEMLVDFLMHAIEFCRQHDTFEFIKNVMEHSRAEDMFNGFSDRMKNCSGQDELELWIYERMDKTDFRYQSYDDFHRFITVAMYLMSLGVRDFYQGHPEEDIRIEYIKKLELLRYGVCSRQK